MTPDQFAALAELLSLRDGPAQECARLVLVEGVPQAEATERTGLSRQAASQVLKRVRAGLELANRAAGL